jgi:hypothetical protein
VFSKTPFANPSHGAAVTAAENGPTPPMTFSSSTNLTGKSKISSPREVPSVILNKNHSVTSTLEGRGGGGGDEEKKQRKSLTQPDGRRSFISTTSQSPSLSSNHHAPPLNPQPRSSGTATTTGTGKSSSSVVRTPNRHGVTATERKLTPQQQPRTPLRPSPSSTPVATVSFDLSMKSFRSPTTPGSSKK